MLNFVVLLVESDSNLQYHHRSCDDNARAVANGEAPHNAEEEGFGHEPVLLSNFVGLKPLCANNSN